MFKRILCLVLSAALAVSLLAGCSKKTAYTTEDYVNAIMNARDEEMNEYFPVYADQEDGGFAMYGGSEDMEEDYIQNSASMIWEFLGLQEEDVEHAAFSVSMMIVTSYGIVIVKPVQGHESNVTESLENFVEQQKQSMENYLVDQYEIASGAIIRTLSGGEIALVMCEDASAVINNISSALK